MGVAQVSICYFCFDLIYILSSSVVSFSFHIVDGVGDIYIYH